MGKKNRRKMEQGSGGPIVYAACFIAFVFAMYLFSMMEYRAKVHMLKDDMETKLHVILNYCLTVNQRNVGGEDLFERERERAHIITVGASNPSASGTDRVAQATEVGKAFEQRIKSEFSLDGASPNGGLLTQMTNHAAESGMSTMRVESLTIFEPTYVRGDVYPVYCGNDHHEHVNACKSPDSCPLPAFFGSLPLKERQRWTEDGSQAGKRIPTGFWANTTTSEWWVYKFTFDSNNSLVSVTATQTLSTPEVMGEVFGQTHAEGATIQATISASFKRPFGFWGEDPNTPDAFQTVYVSEGIDIVYSTDDSRKR